MMAKQKEQPEEPAAEPETKPAQRQMFTAMTVALGNVYAYADDIETATKLITLAVPGPVGKIGISKAVPRNGEFTIYQCQQVIPVEGTHPKDIAEFVRRDGLNYEIRQ